MNKNFSVDVFNVYANVCSFFNGRDYATAFNIISVIHRNKEYFEFELDSIRFTVMNKGGICVVKNEFEVYTEGHHWLCDAKVNGNVLDTTYDDNIIKSCVSYFSREITLDLMSVSKEQLLFLIKNFLSKNFHIISNKQLDNCALKVLDKLNKSNSK